MAVSSAAPGFWIAHQRWPQSIDDVREVMDSWGEELKAWERARSKLADVRFYRMSNRSVVVTGFLLQPKRRAFVATVVMKEAPEVASGWASILDVKLEENEPNKALEPTSTSVMPRAIDSISELKRRTDLPNQARVTPAVAVAHL